MLRLLTEYSTQHSKVFLASSRTQSAVSYSGKHLSPLFGNRSTMYQSTRSLCNAPGVKEYTSPDLKKPKIDWFWSGVWVALLATMVKLYLDDQIEDEPEEGMVAKQPICTGKTDCHSCKKAEDQVTPSDKEPPPGIPN
jgi:hypothetical protein